MRFQGFFLYIKNSIFFLLEQSFSEFKVRLAFLFFKPLFLAFSTCDMMRIFSFIFDNCCFIKVLSIGISFSRFFRHLCSNLSWPFCLLLAVLLWFCWSSDPKCSKHTACTIFVKECNFTLIDLFRLVRRMKDNSSSRVFHLVSLALGQFIRIAFFFTLGMLDWQPKGTMVLW